MKKLFFLTLLSISFAISSFAEVKYVTIIYNADTKQACWPMGTTCTHVLTIRYNTASIAAEFVNAGITVPANETMGLITEGADQGDFTYFPSLYVDANQNQPLPLNIPGQSAYWSDNLNGYLVYFDQNSQN